MKLWWLSFCDPTRPAGQQFLGVAIVETMGPSFGEALMMTWLLSCNPGGEVQGWEVPPDMEIASELRHRLLGKDELAAAGFVVTSVDEEIVLS